jgi:hypothetical protein
MILVIGEALIDLIENRYQPGAFTAIVGEYCDNLRGRLQQTNAHIAEIQKIRDMISSGITVEEESGFRGFLKRIFGDEN